MRWGLFSLLPFALAACAGPPRAAKPAAAAPPQRGGVLRLVLTEPPTLDPAHSEDAYQWLLMEQIYDGVVDLDPELNVMPALAHTWTVSRDGLTYTFRLDPDARFHNGRPVVAEDIGYSFSRAARVKGGLAREYVNHILGGSEAAEGKTDSIQGIEAPDPHTLIIRLAHPYAPFLSTLAIPQFRVVPREAVEGREAEFGRHPVGSGPFRVVEWTKGSLLVLAADDAYHGGRPWLDRVEVRASNFQDDLVGLLTRGEIDMAMVGRNDKARLPPDTVFVQRPEMGLTCLGLNLAFAPWKDPKVRLAAALSVDRAAIVEASGAVAVPGRGVVPDGMPGGAPNAFAPERDVDEARRVLAADGHPGGEGLPVIDFWANRGSPPIRAAAAVVARNLGEIGFRVREQSRPWTEFLDVVNHGRAPMNMLTWIADTPDRDAYLGVLFHSKAANNYLSFSDPDVDRLLDAARQEMDPMARGRLYRLAEEGISSANVMIPLYNTSNLAALRPGLKGFNLDAFGQTDWRQLWWDSARVVKSTSGH